MAEYTSELAAREPFLPLMRALVEAYRAFELLDARLLREHGLTACQADVIFTLGNTEGMTLGELGERTLITKGTLTGVVDRLEDRGLVRRTTAPHDGRCTLAVLTTAGAHLFEEVFPEHIAALKRRFERLDADSREAACRALRQLRAVLE